MNIIKITASNFWLIAILSLTAVYSLIESLRMHQKIESIITLWLLAAGICAVTAWHLIKNQSLYPPA